MNKKLVGHLVSKARKEMKITQEELANAVGKNRVSISNIETGRVEPGIILVGKLARQLDKPIAYFVGEPGNEKKIADMEITAEFIKDILDAYVEAGYWKGLGGKFNQELAEFIEIVMDDYVKYYDLFLEKHR